MAGYHAQLTRSRRRASMARMLKAICCASLAGAALASIAPGQATAATFGVVDARAPFEVKAGSALSVTANIQIYSGPAVRRTCRLTLKQPGGRLRQVSGVRRFSGARARLGWRVPLAVTDPAGWWEARVNCSSGLRAKDSFSVKPARRSVRVDQEQWVPARGYLASRFAWSARVANTYGFDIREGDMRVVFRDAAGRAITTSNYSDAVTLAAGQSAIVGDSVTIEGETPATVEVQVVGDAYRRALRPTEIRDLRFVVVPPSYDGDDPDLEVRGEAVNNSQRPVSAHYMFVSVFDAGGRLLAASADLLPGTIAPGQSQGIDLELGSGVDLVNAAASVQGFWPSTP